VMLKRGRFTGINAITDKARWPEARWRPDGAREARAGLAAAQ
jgi:hypothetical protein